VAIRVRAACGADAAVACTGTRLSSRAVLTAAHCVADTPLGLLELVADADGRTAPGVRVADAWLAGDADLAVLVASAPLGGADAALAALPADAVGRDVTITGYGDDGGGGHGVRLAGTATITARVDPDAVQLGPAPALTCGGDSGGPVALDGAVVAVVSYGDPACAASATAIRVDGHLDAIAAAVDGAAAVPVGTIGTGDADCGAPAGCCDGGGGDAGATVAVAVLAALLLSSRCRCRRS